MNRFLFDAAAALLFVFSSGLLFSETVRASRILFIAVGIVALASSYVLTKHALDSTVGERMHRYHAVANSASPAPTAVPSDETGADALLQTLYRNTENALDRMVRAGTGKADAAVSSDTVIGTIVGILLAVLGLVSQAFSALFRRVTGAA